MRNLLVGMVAAWLVPHASFAQDQESLDGRRGQMEQPQGTVSAATTGSQTSNSRNQDAGSMGDSNTNRPNASGMDDAIRFEREILERQADRQIQGIQYLAELALGVFAGLIATFGVLAGWFLWSTRRELRETVKKSIDRQVETIVADQAKTLTARFKAIEGDIERLSNFGERSVVWVARDDIEAGGQVVAALRANGVANVRAVVPQAGADFEIGEPDLVIVSYDETAEASRRLNLALAQLQHQAPPVPVIVYTFNPAGMPHRVEGIDAEVLSQYAWYVPTNFPLQLLTQVLTLLKRSPLENTQ